MEVINLLPWREYEMQHKRKMQRRSFMLMVFVAVFVVIMIDRILLCFVQSLEQRVVLLQQQIQDNRSHSAVEQPALNQPVMALMNYRKQTAKLFDDMFNAAIDTGCINYFRRDQGKLLFAIKVASGYGLNEYQEYFKHHHVANALTIKKIKQNLAGGFSAEFLGREELPPILAAKESGSESYAGSSEDEQAEKP